jgi:hypothetical protein
MAVVLKPAVIRSSNKRTLFTQPIADVVGYGGSTVRTINYGGTFALQNATDLNTSNEQTGDVIVYDAATHGFEVAPVPQQASFDAGLF